MEPRIASSLLVTALIRRAEAVGGNGTIIAKGDAQAGALLLILSERGKTTQILERILQPDGRYRWQESVRQAVQNEESAKKFLARRREIDPDSWILELDIASSQRFADELNASG